MSTSQRLARRRTTVPAAPAAPSAAGGNTVATITFTAPVTDGGSPITQYRAISSPGGFSNTGAGSPIVVSGLTNGVAYTFTVRATNAVGNSAESAASNSATPSNPATVPAAPTIGTATPGSGQASVTFTPGADGGSPILDYTVYSNSPAQQTGGSSPITVTGLVNGLFYNFTVKARNAVGESAASGTSNTVQPSTVPDAPTIGTASAGNQQASVAFSAPASDGGSAILDYTATSSPGGISVTGSSSPITVPGLTNGQAYTFTVKARNANGQSSASSASNSVTPNVTTHSVTLDKSSITRARANAGALSDTCTATVHDGVGPFVYSWTWLSGGSDITIVNSSSATCTVTSTATPETHRAGTLRCTVTDQGNSNLTATADCDVDMTWSNL